jgi:hypothetical protein
MLERSFDMILRSRKIDRISFRAMGKMASIVACAFLILVGTAQAREETLRWTHSAPADVVTFEAHFGSQAGNYDQVMDLGKPNPDASGIYSATIEVGDGDVYISLRAVGALSAQSPLSNERVREGSTGGGGGGGGGGPVVTPIGAGTSMPQSIDAAKRFDFAALPLGNAVAEWVDTRAGNSLIVDDSLFAVDALAGNRVLITRSTDDDIHSHVVSSDGPWTAFTIRGRMAVDRADAEIGVTTYSQYPNANVYYRLGRNASGAFMISGRPALSCNTGNTGVVPAPGAWYAFELTVSVLNGTNQIQAKVWPQGASEPSGPQASCADGAAGRPSSGTLGVWAAGPGEKAWDDLEIITAPPAPNVPLAPPILIQVAPVQ